MAITAKQAIELGKQLIAQAELAERIGSDFALVVFINEEPHEVTGFSADDRNPYFYIDAERPSGAPRV